LKTQIDDLSTENSLLKLKTTGLADEVSHLKADSTKAQELANKQRAEAESKEKGLQQRLQAALDSLQGESRPLPNTRFSKVTSTC
jgi:regulator of replication initiation timing